MNKHYAQAITEVLASPLSKHFPMIKKKEKKKRAILNGEPARQLPGVQVYKKC